MVIASSPKSGMMYIYHRRNRSINIHSPKKVKDIFFGGYFLLNCNDKSRMIKNTPQKNNILNFFWGVYVIAPSQSHIAGIYSIFCVFVILSYLQIVNSLSEK